MFSSRRHRERNTRKNVNARYKSRLISPPFINIIIYNDDDPITIWKYGKQKSSCFSTEIKEFLINKDTNETQDELEFSREDDDKNE